MFRIFAAPFPTLILSPTIPHRANERNDRCLAFCDNRDCTSSCAVRTICSAISLWRRLYRKNLLVAAPSRKRNAHRRNASDQALPQRGSRRRDRLRAVQAFGIARPAAAAPPVLHHGRVSLSAPLI